MAFRSLPVVLASTSPRRKELLALLQVPFEVVEPDFTEHLRPGMDPDAMAAFFADGKALSCSPRFPDRLVIGSDTLIELDGEVLGKPADLDDARRMLGRLAGREHLIHTAVAVRRQADALRAVGAEIVRVTMADFDARDIEAYLSAGESLDRAGAYSIQGEGGRLIAGIRGDYTAAVGLPLRVTARLLAQCGLPVPVDVDDLYRTKPFPNWGTFER